MKVLLFRIKNLLLTVGIAFCLLCMYECSRPENDENSLSKPDPTGALGDTAMDAIDPNINLKGAQEDSLSGKINGSTSGNNTGRTE